jgi:signal transduction histidine kinase
MGYRYVNVSPEAMNLFIHSQTSPFRLLRLLEWVLLGVAAAIQLVVATVWPSVGVPLLNGLGLAIFAAMRFVLPQQSTLPRKLLFTALEFGLLLLLTFVGEFPRPSLLYIVLVIRNCVLLAGGDVVQGRLRTLITTLAFILCVLSQSSRSWQGRLPIQIWSQLGPASIGMLIVLGLVFLCLQLLVDAVLSERKGQEQLAEANAKLRRYALKIEELATEQERNRIARDIHDSLGHSLTVFNIHLEAAIRLLHSEPTEAEALLLEVKQLGAKALQDVRESVTVLRTDPLQGRSLSEAIAQLVADFQRTTGISPTCTLKLDRPLIGELNLTLYRLVQESLTNICKHAAATEVAIGIQQCDQDIQVIIQDNGRGFNLHHNPLGFGLQGMQERTFALGGTLKIKTAPGQGCHIQAAFPRQSL